jgi:hypothetical protein
MTVFFNNSANVKAFLNICVLMECKNALKRCLKERIIFNKVCYLNDNRAVLGNKCADLRNIRESGMLK